MISSSNPRYVVRPFEDGSWVVVDAARRAYLVTSNDRSQAQRWADRLNTAQADGRLERKEPA